ncbi:uncharacterized protein TRIADDRAFT_56532 [Trichoplax adhaerens]|uniref:ditrans,polycis-polyprenyl diphosphate synthase [(2E,6E)-farnesyldiphosphate specific] n=1 Tax=Trichoplax adhaerens TaxID=10228 RepID=B3RYE7_TRIAD|nr:hypothetical protein TRIADDRAFT_56532 [Trichoplax adhaerens]EDV25025.1 hypothetical protein TRIADDRAFT_56532 [Trichoplax adhaerens]|eukprot:XP_002112915.1 hypothetical protein TRIADDRAFT_56532 [Trichoplax adhaerens]
MNFIQNPGSLIDLSSIHRDSKRMKQIPAHIGLVVVEDSISCKDIAKVIVWSIGIGIPCVTLFDQKGWLKEMRHKINQEVTNYYNLLLSKEKTKMVLSCRNGIALANISIPGYSKPIRLNFLSNSDGRQDIVTAAQKLCSDSNFYHATVTDQEIDRVTSTLHATHGFPDPELVIKFGDIDSMLGFLPWQIRLTEITSLLSHWNLPYSLFLNVIRDYSNCQQRFGK